MWIKSPSGGVKLKLVGEEVLFQALQRINSSAYETAFRKLKKKKESLFYESASAAIAIF